MKPPSALAKENVVKPDGSVKIADERGWKKFGSDLAKLRAEASNNFMTLNEAAFGKLQKEIDDACAVLSEAACDKP
eukprot:14199642-Heterocapsa_arctica.AAC.1